MVLDQFVNTPAGPIRFVQGGAGLDVVLLHGAITSLEDMLLGPFDALVRRFHVTVLDRPGHGATPRRRLRGAPSLQTAHIREAVRALGVQRPIIVGQSFGAVLALDYALMFPDEVAGVVVISPIAFPEVRLEHLLFGPRAIVGLGDIIAHGVGPVFDALLLPILWHAMFMPQKMPARFRAHYPFALASGPDQMLALGEEAVLALPDLALSAARYPSCCVPVSILAGAADLVALPGLHAVKLARALPDARLKLLPGLGHMLHHFAIDEVAAAVDELATGTSRGALQILRRLSTSADAARRTAPACRSTGREV